MFTGIRGKSPVLKSDDMTKNEIPTALWESLAYPLDILVKYIILWLINPIQDEGGGLIVPAV